MGKVCLKSVYARDRDILYSKVMGVLDRYRHLPVVEKTHVLRIVIHKCEEESRGECVRKLQHLGS